MPTTTRKQPQDRKPKQGGVSEDPGDFVFASEKGETVTITREEIDAILTPGFIRRNRHVDDGEVSFRLVESLDREDVLEIIDTSWPDYRRFGEEFGEYVNQIMELSMGESSAS